MSIRIGLILAIGAALGSGCRRDREWTVLSSADVDVLRRPCSRDFPEGLTGYWAPTARDLDGPERLLGGVVQRELERVGPGRGPAPEAYHRQYVGFERGGRRVIYLNAVAKDRVSDEPLLPWSSRAVMMCDGGVSSFGAVYDPSSDRFDWFQFNGPLPRGQELGPR